MNKDADTKGYVCPYCQKRFAVLDAVSLEQDQEDGLFLCDRCPTKLVDDDDSAEVKTSQERLGRLMEQMKRIIELLKLIDDVVVPTYVLLSGAPGMIRLTVRGVETISRLRMRIVFRFHATRTNSPLCPSLPPPALKIHPAPTPPRLKSRLHPPPTRLRLSSRRNRRRSNRRRKRTPCQYGTPSLRLIQRQSQRLGRRRLRRRRREHWMGLGSRLRQKKRKIRRRPPRRGLMGCRLMVIFILSLISLGSVC